MSAWYAADLTSLCFTWRIVRRDGVTLGFTSHDADIMVGGLIYRAAPGMLPSSVERSDSLDPGDVQLTGALTSSAFVEEDLIAGRWDGAALSLSVADWSAPSTTIVPIIEGSFGAIEIKDGSFSVGLRGGASRLERPVVETTSPECRAVLGDRRCRIDLADRRRVTTVASVSGVDVVLSSAPSAAGEFAWGRIRWLDGANAGLSIGILASNGTALKLRDEPAFMVLPGSRAELTEGCDKLFATCVGRFANADNFRGEPHLPGNDLLTRYGS